jgi:alpha-tubulin suppressor-like RCC1 family protein
MDGRRRDAADIAPEGRMSVRRASTLWTAGLTLAFLFLPRLGAGAPVSEATARLVARNFMTAHVQAHGSWNGVASPTITSVTLVTYQGAPIAYNIAVSPSGHLLVAYDDEFSPVLLYSDRSSWDPAKVTEPDTLEAWIVDETHRTYERLKGMDAETRSRLRTGATREAAQVESAWARFGRGEGRVAPRALSALSLDSRTTQVVAGPLLATAWDQGTTTPPFTYNLYTPAISGTGGCAHTYVGCTATAIAQLMKFWNWPPTGTGNHSYAWNGQTLSTDFTRTYNWSSMPVSLSASSTSTEIDAVARLMFDVGISIDMDYSCTGSAAPVYDAVFLDLIVFFKYRFIGQSMARSDYTADQFFRLLKADVDIGRPDLMEVWSATAGHAVVIDGYQVLTGSTSQVHVNLGWGGAYTGWYDITNNWSTGYNWIASTQVAYRGIEPNDGVVRGPGSPVLLGPAGPLEPMPPVFTWAPVPGATRYRVIAYQGWSDPANPATGSMVYRADSITDYQAGCANWRGNCAYKADGSIPAGIPTAFTVGATNDIDPDWDYASPYFEFTLARVGTPSAGAVGQTTTTMSAPVNPNGVATTAYFEYGVTTGYGSTTAAQSLGAGTTTVTLTATMNSLACGTTYHYRAVATDSGGTTAGADGTFTTLPCGTPSRVAAGAAHTCVLTAGGGVTCWGANDSGQLGDGTTTGRLWPVPVTGLATGVAAIAAGGYHTCLLTTAGGVRCWGANNYGQLGDGTTTDRSTPAAVTGLDTGVTAIAAGESHTCAVTISGGVKCWGFNSNLQLGDGTTTTRTAPVSVNLLARAAVAVTAGSFHTCALTINGGVTCWGDNWGGQLGDGTGMARTVPVAVSGLTSGVAAIAAGDYHTCAVTAGGGAMCWGSNESGLGDGTIVMVREAPVPVTGLASGVEAIAVGRDHTCALTTGGGVQCWGGNGYGQLGDGTRTSSTVPVAVIGLTSGVAAIAAGADHTCAATTGGGAACWGRGNSGQLGDGTTLNRFVPTAVARLAPPCIFSIAPSSASPGFSAGSQSVTITMAPTGCTGGEWTASGNGSWLTVSPTSGSGSGSVTVLWSENTAYAPRTGSATVAGASFTVTQGATPPPLCAGFTISPSSASPTYSAGQQVVILTGLPGGCAGGSWTAAGNGSWLTVSPTSGTGPGQITVSWTQNPVEAPRSDSATIAGSAFPVTQAALPPVIFTDDPMLERTTAVKVVHLVELRAAIGQLRAKHGLGPFLWTDPTLVAGVTVVKAVHLTELRAALNEVYAAAGREAPAYTGTISAGMTAISAAHINELHAAILAIW